MVVSEALKYLSTSALSLTLSGNTGVAPFLTLFLVGIIERSDPTLLYMDGWVEKILASWPGIVIFGILTVLEFVGKCVPVVDEIIDSAEVMVVPIFSVLGSLASHGLYTAPDSAFEGPQGDGRRLEGDDGGAGGLVTFLQVVLSAAGICLALLVHLCKMVVRLLGEGCCTPCITAGEITWVAASVTLCIYIVPVAIGAAALLLVAAGFGFRSWWKKRQEKKATAKAGGDAAGESKGADEEQGKRDAKADGGSDAAESGKNPELGEGVSGEDEKLQPLLP